MGKPKPRPYRVTKARLEWAEAIVWATSAAEAEQSARDDLTLQWDFTAAPITGLATWRRRAVMICGRDTASS